MSYSNNIPLNIQNKIILDAIILKRLDNGWREINALINKKCVYVKKTNYSRNLNIRYEIVKSVNSFYSENTRIFIWTKKYEHMINTNIYTYGNPFGGYLLDMMQP